MAQLNKRRGKPRFFVALLPTSKLETKCHKIFYKKIKIYDTNTKNSVYYDYEEEKIMSVKDYLTCIIKNSKFTQEQIAKCMNVAQSTVSKWMSGERKIGTEEFVRLLSILGYSTSDYINEKTTLPLQMSFRGRGFKTKDIEAIGFFNRLVANLRLMEEIDCNETRS